MIEWIDGRPILTQFEMQFGTAGVTAVAAQTDDLSLSHLLATHHVNPARMAVSAHPAVAMVDEHQSAEYGHLVARIGNHAIGGHADGDRKSTRLNSSH